MLRFAKAAFLVLVFSLAFMKPNFAVGGLLATVTDLLFMLVAGALGLAIVSGRKRLRWDPLYAVLLIYFAAMAVSALFSQEPQRSWFRLATQAYLLSLPVLCASLVDNRDDLRAVILTWIAASTIPAVIGMLTVFLVAIGMDHSPLDFARHEFGSLAPGNYARIEATFRHPAMLCGYLTVSLLILLAAGRVGWIARVPFYLLFGAIIVAAVFTLTPGLGGIFLALGIRNYARMRGQAEARASASLALGGIFALLFVASAVVTPIIHPTAPFLIELPGLQHQVAPAVRLLTWADAVRTFLAHPLLGTGIGTDAAAILFVDPSGHGHFLTDAHNVFLNVAAGTGVVGLAALMLLVIVVVRMTVRVHGDELGTIRFALGLAWLIGFVYGGLTGSYEDARHLWVILGLLLACWRMEQRGGSALAPPLRTS